ncbi:MAG TPA: Ig-like domain-containing protein [Anaerolineales bacterium]|nr:Ig-like domain-containing protein [Anaerolineales bacterium]
MTNSFRRLLIPLTVAVLILLETVVPVYAGEPYAPQQKLSNLAIEPLKPFVTGEHPTVTVHLTSEFGKPIPKQPITLFVDGKRKARGLTDSRGIAQITLNYKFPAGKYTLLAVYPGILSIGLPAAIAKTNMAVEPATLAIYTVPPTPGVVFKLNNQTYTTDKTGTADIEVTVSGTYSLEVLPIAPTKLPSNVRMEFSRWNDNVFTAKRQVYFPRDNRIEAGFTVKYQVNQAFHDAEGKPVDPARISSMVIAGAGNTFTFDQAGPIWLPANRLTRRINERLQSEEILYYFRDVTIDGASVVNKGEQRFRIQPDDVWPIQVLLYSVEFSARDAMFHFPIGKGVELTYPDGHQEQFSFNSSNAQITIPSLARGSYSAKIIGVGGSAPATPIHLSRDQSVELLMLSYLDMAIIVGIPLLIVLLFFFLGRPHWFQALRHPSKFRELVYQHTQRDV